MKDENENVELDEEELEDEDLEEEEDEEGESTEEEDDETQDDGQTEETTTPPSGTQDPETRARHAKARRAREAKERELREKEIRRLAYLQGQLDGIRVNTYTNEPIVDEYDLEIFKIQMQLEAEGKDPIADLPKRQAEIARATGKKAKDEEEARRLYEERIDRELNEFTSKYPKVKTDELLKDPDFKEYADGRLGVGNKTLTQIYESFLALKQRLGGKPKKEEDDGQTPPPSPTGGRKHEKTSYSRMSKEERIAELRRQGLIP